MRLYIYFNNGTLDTDIIISGFSYTQNYYNNLTPADNYIRCSIPFDVAISNAIKSNINSKVKAIIKNDDNSSYFTGYLKQDAQFGKESRLDNISIEIVSPSYFLEISYSAPEYYLDKTLKECVQILLDKASISSYDINNLSEKNIPVFAIEENEKVSDILSELLREYGYCYDFDRDGKFIINPLFNTPSSVVQAFRDGNGGNLRGRVSQRVSAKKYDGVSAQFDTLEYAENQIIYDDTGDNDIDANGYFGGTQNGAYCDYAIEGKSVKYIDSINEWEIKTDAYKIDEDHPQTSIMQGSIDNYGSRALIKVQNMIASKITLKEIKINGNGYFITSTGKAKTTDGNNIHELKLKYIFNEDDAEIYASNITKYYRYANLTVSLQSKIDYVYGSFVTVTIENLGSITGRIIQKTKQLKTDVITYTIESISEFTPATISTIYSKMPQVYRNYSNHVITLYKKSTTEITETGITGNAVYDFSTNNLRWEGGSSNGWSINLSDVSGNDGLLYVTSATAYGKNNTDTIEPNEWAEPIAQGMNGVNGYNTRTIQLFRRSDAAPQDMPLNFTLDFTQRDISISTYQLNGWQKSFPAVDDDNNPVWEIHVTALSNTTTDIITSAQWSSPAKISQDTEVTKAEIQEMINDSMLDSAPVVYADVTYGGYYVDNNGLTLAPQSITTDIRVLQNDRELDFTFGKITLPSGFSASHDGNKLTISVNEGVRVTTGTINIPVIYRPYLSTDTYGDEDGNVYVDEDGNDYGYWILASESTTYNLGFGYSQIKGEIYLGSISDIASLPSDAIIGSYFTWNGENTTSNLSKDGTFVKGAVYKYNGSTWQKDISSMHLQTALSDILTDAQADLENNNPDVVGLFSKIASSQAIINQLVVTGNALVNQLQALNIYADKFESYDSKAQGYASDSYDDAIAHIESETGLDTLADKTLIQGGKIKTGLIQADALVIGSSQVTGLDGTINTINNSLTRKADASIVSSLEGTVTSQGSSISTINEIVTSQGTKINEIDGTVTSQGEDISDISDNLSNNYTNTSDMNAQILNAKNGAINKVYEDTGLDTLTNQTIIQNGKIKTDLVDALAIKSLEGFFDNITSDNGTFTNVSVSGEIKGNTGYFEGVLGKITKLAENIDPTNNFDFTIIDSKDFRGANTVKQLKIYMYVRANVGLVNVSYNILLADLIIKSSKLVADEFGTYTVKIDLDYDGELVDNVKLDKSSSGDIVKDGIKYAFTKYNLNGFYRLLSGLYNIQSNLYMNELTLVESDF